jgi:outer membrane autotransporter protein
LNSELISVESDNTVAVKALTVSSSGPAYSDAGTLALAYGKGVDSGAGDDGIINTDTVFVKAKPRILSATRTFGSGGNVDGKVGILLNGTATGITGGEGNDAINNEGNVLVFVGVQDTGSTVSENAVSGSTTIKDNSFTTPADPQALVGKWIRITGGENPDFFTQVVGFDPDAGTFTLRDPLKYDLPEDATYVLYDYGNKTPDITSLNVTVGGRTRVDASTTASVQAKGIIGGDGDDHIVNAGTTAVSASNLVKSVTLNLTRNIVADTRIESTVNAVGIEGNDQSSVTDVSDGETNVFTDLSRKGEDPEAIVGKVVLFKSGSSTEFATLVTAFDPETGTFTLADPLPPGGLSRGDIYTLGEGSDSITNLGAIGVNANSGIDASSWSLSFGSADIEAVGRAQALSAGMRGGAFNDSFQNYGGISARSTADVSSTERVLVAFGSADQKLIFEAASNSVGVDAGAGDDQFINAENSSIHAEAASKADVNGVTTTLLAEVKNSVNAIADSTALGLDLGQGNNVAYNEGEFWVSANAITNAQAISESVCIPFFGCFNETNADADAIAKASAWGIRAGSGEDQVFNRNLIQVDASADATSVAQGGKVGSEDDTSTVTENSNVDSFTFVDASLKGQNPSDLVGKWVRFLKNETFFTQITGFNPETGTVILAETLPFDLKAAILDDDGNVIIPADEYTFSAARDGTSASVASALATGIDVGDGNAIVQNTGVISVKAFAKADTTAKTFGGQVTAEASSSSEARGIRTGSGDDVIRNAGVIDVKSEVIATTSGASATEISTATGIDAGDGNNKIVNEGVINVTASADRSNAEVKAQGIIAGSGDDTIINSGSIISSTIINGTRELGIAIATGAGNDKVVLAQGSVVEGSINLGKGDDILAFTGNPVVSGEVTGESGTDALIFDGTGSIGSTPMAFENAIKQGAGTYSVASLPTMQRIEVNQGTLQVNNDYAMASDSTFQTNVNGDGSHGQLKVNGTTTLDGALKVVRGPGAYVDGTTYDILTGDVVNGWFTSETLPEPTPLVSFVINSPRDHVEVEAQVNSFATVTNNSTHRKIGRYLDKILPGAKGDLAYVLGEIQLLSEPGEFNTAYSSLSPDSYDNYTRGTLFATQQYNKSLQYRMNNVRYHFMAGSPDNEKPILLAYSGSDASLGQLFTPGEFSQIQGKSGLWLDAFGQWGDQDEEDGFTGYDYFLRGATLGFDHRLMDNLMAGLSLGYSRSDIDLDQNQGSGDVKSFFGSLYGSYFDKNLYIDAILSYGRNWYDNSRLITIGGILRRATSDHDAHLFSGYLGGGYYFDFNPWAFGPYGSLQYIRLDEESFEEKGAGAISLRVDDRQTDALVSELGVRLVRLIRGKCGNFIPEVSLGWSHDFDIDDHVVRASFAGSPGASFSIDGQDVERNGLVVGAGLTFIHKGGFSTSFRYKGDFRGDYKSNGVMGEIRFTF